MCPKGSRNGVKSKLTTSFALQIISLGINKHPFIITIYEKSIMRQAQKILSEPTFLTQSVTSFFFFLITLHVGATSFLCGVLRPCVYMMLLTVNCRTSSVSMTNFPLGTIKCMKWNEMRVERNLPVSFATPQALLEGFFQDPHSSVITATLKSCVSSKQVLLLFLA